MSFGRPPGFTTFSVTPPDRGSFPLDHEGECTKMMQEYMSCLKAHKNDSGQCRHLSRRYLECRMDKGLMEKDEMSNLGFQGQGTASESASQGSGSGVPPAAGKADDTDEAVAGKSGTGKGWFSWAGSGSRSKASSTGGNGPEDRRI